MLVKEFSCRIGMFWRLRRRKGVFRTCPNDDLGRYAVELNNGKDKACNKNHIKKHGVG